MQKTDKPDKLCLEKVKWEKTEKIFYPDKNLILQSLVKKREHDVRTKEILKLLASGVVIALSFVIPALPMAVAPFIVDSKKFHRSRFNQAVKRLKKRKLVEVIEKDGMSIVKITSQGRIKALSYKMDDMKIDKPKVWDNKWRVIIFDVPEHERGMRDIFRKRLKFLGFYNLQESVWVHPYPCFDQIEYLRQIYNVGINVCYMVAEKIEDTEGLKHHFTL